MNILAIGDVCGSIGCNYLLKVLPIIKKKENIDCTIVNGENSADGNGLTPLSAKSLFAAGADIITGGNHTLRRKEVYPLLDENDFLLRPDNFSECSIGSGYAELDLGFAQLSVINLSGRVWMPDCDNPFAAADELIKRANDNGIKIIMIDFHGECTAEKRAFAEYVDGRASAVFGTHTHVQTADEKVLKNGTGFITDLGMVGPLDSVLGVKTELSIAKIKDGAPVKFSLADGKCILNACIFNIDKNTGKTVSVKRISIEE